VSQLKKKLGATSQVQHQVPHEATEQILEPELIIDRRMVKRNNKTVAEILVKWKHLTAEEASWEEYWALVKFPHFDLETRSNLRGSVVTSLNFRNQHLLQKELFSCYSND